MSLKVYDKAQWHIDNGAEESEIIEHFNFIFNWLKDFKLLSDEGLEMLGIGIDSSISLNENMVNFSGRSFLDKNYDEYIKNIQYGINENAELLEKLYFKL